MEIKAASGEITRIDTGAIIVSQFEGEKAPEGATDATDKKLGGAIAEMIKQGDIKGKLNEITLIHSLGKLPAGRVCIIGLGKKKELTINKMTGWGAAGFTAVPGVI